MKAQYERLLPIEQETITVAAMLGRVISAPCVFFLHGELGAGKTTFVRAFLQAKGVMGRIKSPTYTLIEPYELSATETAYHFDLYRLNDASELDNLGIDEYFSPTSICLVEWPEKGGNRLPAPDIEGYLTDAGRGRALRLVGVSAIGQAYLQEAFGTSQ